MDRIQLRRDTSARWAEINPILLEGEVGFETDTKLRKIGDGVNRWNDLEYLKAEGISQDMGMNENLVMSQKTVTNEIIDGILYHPNINNEIKVIENLCIVWGGTKVGSIEKNNDYCIAIATIPSNATNVALEGVEGTNFFFYSSNYIETSTLVAQYGASMRSIPTGSRVLGINIKKSDYNNEKITLKWGNVKTNFELYQEVVRAVINNNITRTESLVSTAASHTPAFKFIKDIYLPKGTYCKIHFYWDKPIEQISFYNTVNATNIDGGYETFFEGKRDLKENEYTFYFSTLTDGYLMFNFTVLEENIGGVLNADLYLDSRIELNNQIEGINNNLNYLQRGDKLFQFGGTQFELSSLGQNAVTNWASVVHGVVMQDVDTLYVIKANQVEAVDNLIFRLYKGKGVTPSEACSELIDIITITPSEYNQIKKGGVVKLPLNNNLNISIDDYYTLEVEVGTQQQIKFGACDAKNRLNFIRNGLYKVSTSGNWVEVSTYPSGKYNYGLLWGIYIGEGKSVNFDNDWQSKFYMYIITDLESKVGTLENKLLPNVEIFKERFSFTGARNTDDSLETSELTMEFKFANFYFEKGKMYRLKFSSNDNSKVRQFSAYSCNKLGSINYGYISLLNPEAVRLPTKEVIVDYNAIHDGYFMYNTKIIAGYELNVSIYELSPSAEISYNLLEEGLLKGNGTGSGQNSFIYFNKLLKAGNKYILKTNQNLSGTFVSVSAYVLYKQGSLSEGYEVIYEGKTLLISNDTVEYRPTRDGYLMMNTLSSIEKELYIQLYEEVVGDSSKQDFDDVYRAIELKQDNLSLKNKAKTIAANSVGIFPCIKPKLSDVYLTLTGDSIFAFQNVYNNDKLGVSAVPPTCDRTANANKLWNAIKWGNAIYRRFDYGKASLLKDYDNSFSDDSKATFKETGTFQSEYIGASMRATAGNNANNYQTTTKVDFGTFPYQFDNSEDSWWQRNIPKRFSNSANASIQFTIPAGYSKFDFLFHAHIYGDSVTITTNRNDGIVKVNAKPNDWGNATEANNSVKDLSMTNYSDETGRNGGNDSFGIPNMRLYFQITDTSNDTIVTITKSSDTSKYLIYWGITYWGTTALPYALHINNMAVGGYGQANIYALRKSMFKYIHRDAVIMEMCYNNLAGGANIEANMRNNMDLLKQYFNDININLNNVGIWIPHCGVPPYTNHEEVAKINYSSSERVALELGYNVIANMKKLFEDVNDVYYESKNRIDFMKFMEGDGVHLGQNGHDIYQAGWEALR